MRTCPHCGGEVPDKPLGQVGEPKTYCSVRCRSAAQVKREREQNPWDRSDRPCRRCGKAFTPRTPHHAYCSGSCQKEAANRLRYGSAEGTANYYRTLFILERCGDFRCEECAGEGEKLHVHHVVPLAKGGAHVPANVRVLCETCHKAQHAIRTPRAKAPRSPEPQPDSSPPHEPLRAMAPLQRPIIQKR